MVGVTDDDRSFDSTVVHLDLPAEATTPPTRFGMEHWMYLVSRGLISGVPRELVPLPIPVHDGALLGKQLREWDIIDANGNLDPEAESLFSVLLGDYDEGLYGQVRFPGRASLRTLNIPAEAADWGLSPEMIVVPRHPLMITRSERQVVTAVSSADELSVNVRATGRSRDSDLADEVLSTLDPSSAWGPRDMSRVRAPREVIDRLAANPLVGSLSEESTPSAREKIISEVVTESGLSHHTARALTELLSAPIAAITQLVAVERTGTGQQESRSAALSVLMLADEKGGAVVCGPAKRMGGYGDVIYAPATREQLSEVIGALFSVAEYDSRHRDPERDKVWDFQPEAGH